LVTFFKSLYIFALDGVLNRIRDLNLPIISVQCVSPNKKGERK